MNGRSNKEEPSCQKVWTVEWTKRVYGTKVSPCGQKEWKGVLGLKTDATQKRTGR